VKLLEKAEKSNHSIDISLEENIAYLFDNSTI